ncbi:Myb- protein A [Basidiobolus ranarum]|uniref:Myb- protein A n=1 Tax=Basidiobolus ranarum TaxID=34480 RepID=A0ABR2WZI8_9FUNG
MYCSRLFANTKSCCIIIPNYKRFQSTLQVQPQLAAKRETRRWTEEEKSKLIAEVEKHGTAWRVIRNSFPERSTNSLARLWYRMQLEKNVHKHGRWSREEDESLLELMDMPEYRSRWKVISEALGRTPESCMIRWRFNLDPKLRKGKWTQEEDATLLDLIKEHGRRWSVIANKIERSEHSCLVRYYDHLDPNIKQGRWSEEEDQKLLEGVRQHGFRWSEIVKDIPGRYAVGAIARYRSYIHKQSQTEAKRTPTIDSNKDK